jgi:hypothetical protein
VGFESSRVARRRLASLAATNERVQEALAPSAFPDLFTSDTTTLGTVGSVPDDMPLRLATHPRAHDSTPRGNEPTPFPSPSHALVQHLDDLAQDIVSTPGAGGALLASYAAQARALTLVLEAARRSEGAPLPASVLLAAQHALTPPQALQGLALV